MYPILANVIYKRVKQKKKMLQFGNYKKVHNKKKDWQKTSKGY